MHHQKHAPLDMDQLFADLSMHGRRKTVKSLLAGNDTQCFTTQQYLDCYIRVINKGDRNIMDLALAETHLRSLAEIREVKPGIWTLSPS